MPNPYASPTSIDDPSIPRRASQDPFPQPIPRSLRIVLGGVSLAYGGLAILLLTSTATDRFYGYFYLPVLSLLIVWTIVASLGRRRVRYLGIATVITQTCLTLWLSYVHGIRTPTWLLAILPTVVIVIISVVYFIRESRTDLMPHATTSSLDQGHPS